jgi:hypothetical protein
METNPYQAPADTPAEPRDPNRSEGTSAAEHVVAISVLGCISLVLAALVTPADPYSTLILAILLFVLTLSAYLFGFRRGRRQPSRNVRRD